MPEVREGTLDARVAPTGILPRHPLDQFADFRDDTATSSPVLGGRGVGHYGMKATAIAWSVALTLATIIGAQSPDTLDLTGIEITSPTPFDPNEGVSISPGTSSDRMPPKLGIRLLEISPNQCHWNEPIVFTVEVVNLDSKPFRFPWAYKASVKPEGPGPRLSRPDGRGPQSNNQAGLQPGNGFIEGNVRLVFIQSNGWPAPLGLPTAFRGSDNLPATIKLLKPGERAVIRARTTCARIGNAALRRHVQEAGVVPIEVLAELTIAYGPDAGGVPVRSEGTELVLVR